MPSFKALSSAILCALAVVSATVIPFEVFPPYLLTLKNEWFITIFQERSELSVRDTCAEDVLLAVELLRAYAGSHFYTTSAGEMKEAVTCSGFVQQENAGMIYPIAVDNTVPFYRANSESRGNHFYTTNVTEFEAAITTGGFSAEGAPGYIYADGLCGAQPFYRLYSATIPDYFYTLSEDEVVSTLEGSGQYVLQGVAGYILPAWEDRI